MNLLLSGFSQCKLPLVFGIPGLQKGRHQNIPYSYDQQWGMEMGVKLIWAMPIRGGRRPMGNSKKQKFDGCSMDSHFIGLGLLRTVFGIVVACREGPAPEFCFIAGNIEGGISKHRFRPITFDWSVLRT